MLRPITPKPTTLSLRRLRVRPVPAGVSSINALSEATSGCRRIAAVLSDYARGDQSSAHAKTRSAGRSYDHSQPIVAGQRCKIIAGWHWWLEQDWPARGVVEALLLGVANLALATPAGTWSWEHALCAVVNGLRVCERLVAPKTAA
jgi:hypothetical protein